MQTFKSPLVGSYNQRSFSTATTLDQKFKACIITKVVNQSLNSASYYLEKRNGLLVGIAPSVGNIGNFVLSGFSVVSGFGAVNSTIYVLTTSVGTITGIALHCIETLLGGVYYELITSSDGTGWFLASDSYAQTAYTCTTHTNTTVDGIPSTAGMYAGQAFTGSGVQAGTRIASVDSAVAITLTLATTTSTTGTFTKTPVAKIIDADFPSAIVGPFAEMDGYLFVMQSNPARIYNSDLNSITSWSASGFITPNISTDVGRGVLKYKNQIMAFGPSSIEFFYNAGNAAGSILSASPTLACGVGVSVLTRPGKLLACKAKDGVYWLANDGSIYTMNGFTPTRVTNQGRLSISTDLYNEFSYFFYANQTMLYMGGAGSVPSYCYSIENSFLWEPSFPALAHFGGDTLTTYCCVEDASGGVFGLTNDSAVFQDNGSTYTMSVRIATDMGTNKRKFGVELRLIADVQASGSVAVSYSDDDGVSFSTARNIALTSIAAMKLNRLGSWKGSRLWKFEHSANTAFRTKQIEIDYSVAA